MKPITSKLTDVLRDIKSGLFVIPRFQRQFVWDANATCKLIDSIARDYPIGAMLTLPSEALALACSELKWAGAEHVSVAPPGAFHLLDGQQRITSLARALLGDPKRQYLFDLEAIYQEKAAEAAAAKASADNPSYESEPACDEQWVIYRARQKKPYSHPSHLRCEDVLNTGLAYSKIVCFIRNKFPDCSEEEIMDKATPLLNAMESVRNYQVIAHQMAKNPQYSEICRIFETINNTGQKLDTFDLIVAKGYSPTFDLREKVDEIKLSYPLVKDVPDESILHAIHYYNGLAENKRARLSKAALLDTPVKKWAESLVPAAEAYSRLIQWLQSQRLSATSKGGLVPATLQTLLVACEMLYPGSLDNQVLSVKLRRWLLCTLWGSPTYDKSNSEGDLLSLRAFFEESQGSYAFRADLPTVNLGKVSADEVLRIGPSARKHNVILAVTMANLTRDLFGGVITESTVLEDHHILPRAVCERLGIDKKTRDSIANRVMVTHDTNCRIIKDSLPAHYFTLAREICGEAGAKRQFQANLISEEFIEGAAGYQDGSRFRELLRGRATLIAAQLNEYFGIDANASALSEPEDTDGLDDDTP